MFSSKSTFFCYITLALTLVAVSDATNSNLNRRHIDVARLIKKRAPLSQDSGLIGVAPDPSLQDSEASSSSISTDSLSASTTPLETTPTPSSATPSTPLTPLLGSSTSPTTTPTTTTTSTSTTSTSTSLSLTPSLNANVTSSASSLTTTSTPATTPATQTSQTIKVVGVSDTSVASTPKNTQTITQTTTGQAQSATAPPTAASATTTTKKTTLTVLIVIASCIGGVAVIWTIIRKWKFRPSSQFEDRMQPIDWQPTSSPDDGISSAHRRLSNASSFQSGSNHIDNNAGRGVGYGATSDHNPLPDHDFTPGVATLAPVGGYADLARGPSPQPQMQQALSRGPSANRPNFGVPIHHQAAYGAQDPYGGVY